MWITIDSRSCAELEKLSTPTTLLRIGSIHQVSVLFGAKR